MSNCNFGNNYSNANVAAFLPLYSGNIDADLIGGTLTTGFQPNITQTGTLTYLSVTGNIDGNGYIQTTSNITSTNGSLYLPAGNIYLNGELVANGEIYSESNIISNANVQADNGVFLSVYTGNIYTDGYYYANGAPFTGGASDYSNANVASYLSTFNGPMSAGSLNIIGGEVVGANISVTGNVFAAYFSGDGSNLSNIQSNYGNSNVAAYLPTYTGALRGANVSVTGNVTGQYILGNAAFMTGLVTSYGNSNVADFLPTYTGNISGGNLNLTNNIYANNIVAPTLTIFGNASVTGNVSANYYVGNGSLLTGINAANLVGAYSNANVANYMPTYLPTYNSNIGANNITLTNNLNATGNITGNYIYGNGAFLSGLPAQYSNANVASYLPIYSGNLSAGNVSATGNIAGSNLSVIGNIQGSYLLGNGAFISGLPASYGNANVAAYLPTYTGNLSAGNVSTVGNVGNITGANYVIANAFIGSGANLDLTNLNGHVVPGSNGVFTLGNISNQWAELWVAGNTIYLGNIPLTTTDSTLIVNGSNVLTAARSYQTGDLLLTGQISSDVMAANSILLNNETLTIYNDSNVAAYLPTYTGNLSANIANFTLVNTPYTNFGNLTVTGDSNIGNLQFSIATGTVVNVGGVNVSNTATANNIFASNVGNLTTNVTASLVNTTTANVGNTTTVNLSATGNTSISNWSFVPQLWFKGQLTGTYALTTGDNLIDWTANNDPNNWYNSGNQRITPGRIGWYQVISKINIDGVSSSNQFNTQIRVNDVNQSIAVTEVNTTNTSTLNDVGVFYLSNITDYFTITCYPQVNGQTIGTGTTGSSLFVHWIST